MLGKVLGGSGQCQGAPRGGLEAPWGGLGASKESWEHWRVGWELPEERGSTQEWSGITQERVREHLGVFRKAQEDVGAPWGSGALQPSPPR